MESEELELRDYLRVLSKRKTLILVLLLASMVSAYFFSKTMAPVYQATTTLLIKGPSSMQNPFSEALGVSNNPDIQNYVEILKSRTLVQKASDRLDLGLAPGTPAFDQLRSAISVQAVQGTDVVRVAVESADPAKARDVANAVVDSFSDLTQQSNRQEASGAADFISSQLPSVEADLRSAESALQRYKETQKIYSPSDEVKAKLDQLTNLETSRAEAKVGLEEARQRLDDTKRQLGGEQQTIVAETTITKNPLIQDLQSKLSDLETQLAGAEEKYTDKHPTVQALRAQIGDVKQQLSQEVAKIISAETKTVNPIYQGLLQQVISLQTEVLAQETRYNTLGRLAGDIDAGFKDLPAKELELARLERNAKVTEGIYVMLKQKYEEMRITEAMKTSDTRVIDRAITPTTPVKPKVKLNVAIAAFLGLFVGIGLAFLLEYLDTTLKTKEDVERVLGLSVLGQIPRFEDAASGSGRRDDRRHSHRQSSAPGQGPPVGGK